MADAKTSTFTIHHDRCKPEAWTAKDVLAFANFVSSGDIRYAAHLSRLGVQLIMSEHHVPKGGTIQEVGWSTESDPNAVYDDLSEAVSMSGDDDVTPLTRMYRGHVEYIARWYIGDGDGNIEGTEFEIKPTETEAEVFLAGMREPESATVS
jgi:hypothetical protein